MRFPKLLLCGATALMALACSREDKTLDSQSAAIENFLKSKNIEYQQIEGVYKYTYYTTAISGTPRVVTGDSVSVFLAGYLFQNGLGALYYTNIETLATAAGFDLTVYPPQPKHLKVGDGGNLSGLNAGLLGSAAGDSLYLFMDSGKAYKIYGSGIVGPSTSVAFLVVIDKIIGK